MKIRLVGLFAIVTIILALTCVSFGQGKGKGNSGNKGKGNGNATVGDVFGGDNNSNRGRGNGKKDDQVGGIFGDNQKGKGKGNSNRFKGLSKKTGISQEALQTRYAIEKRLNPDLTYGQFVAAHMVAKNHRGVSTGDILGGLRNGQSIGQILHDRGWDKDKINKERKRIKKDRDKDDDGDYDDNDRTWRYPF